MLVYQVQYEHAIGSWTVCIIDDDTDTVKLRLICSNRRQADLIAVDYSMGKERHVVTTKCSLLSYLVQGTCSRARDVRRITSKLPRFFSLTTLTTLAA
jgi:hypothetical protein